MGFLRKLISRTVGETKVPPPQLVPASGPPQAQVHLEVRERDLPIGVYMPGKWNEQYRNWQRSSDDYQPLSPPRPVFPTKEERALKVAAATRRYSELPPPASIKFIHTDESKFEIQIHPTESFDSPMSREIREGLKDFGRMIDVHSNDESQTMLFEYERLEPTRPIEMELDMLAGHKLILAPSAA